MTGYVTFANLSESLQQRILAGGSGGAGILVINDLTTGGTLDALSAEMGKVLKGELDGVNLKVTSLDTDLDTLKLTVESQGTTIGTIETTLSGLNVDVEALKVSMATANKDITDLKTKTDTTNTILTTLEGKVNTVEGTVAELETDVTALEVSVQELDGRIDSLELSSTEVNDKVSNLETGLTTVSDKVSTLETKMTAVEGEVSNTKQGLEQVESDLATTNIQVASKVDKSDIVNNLTGGTDKVLSAEQGKVLKTSVDKVTGDLEQTDTKVASLEGNVSTITEEIDTVNSQITSLQTDKVNKSDIVNDLTTGGIDKVLSAEQGKELFTSVSNGKRDIATAITDKGVPTEADAEFAQMVANINSIQTGAIGVPTAKGNAKASVETITYFYYGSGSNTKKNYVRITTPFKPKFIWGVYIQMTGSSFNIPRYHISEYNDGSMNPRSKTPTQNQVRYYVEGDGVEAGTGNFANFKAIQVDNGDGTWSTDLPIQFSQVFFDWTAWGM